MRYKSSEIGKMLKETRERKHLTQQDLASKICKKRSYISRIENNGASVNLKTLQEIVEIGLEAELFIDLKTK